MILSGVSSFLHWWREALLRLLPTPFRRGLFGGRQKLLVLAEPEMPMTLWAGRKSEPIGGLDTLPTRQGNRLARQARRGKLDIALVLPQDVVGVRRIELPDSAARELRNVLGFEIDRLTPFDAQELHFAGQILDRNRANATIDVAVTYAPRECVAPYLDRLQRRDLAVSHIGTADGQGTLPEPNLLEQTASRALSLGRALSIFLIVLGLGLAAALWFQAVDRREDRIAALELELKELRGRLLSTHAQDLPPEASAARTAHVLKTNAAPMIVLLDRLTALLPDGTSVAVLDIADGTIRLTGESDDPAALIPLFAAEEGFWDPTFDAPIVRNDADGRDRFLLSVRIAGATP